MRVVAQQHGQTRLLRKARDGGRRGRGTHHAVKEAKREVARCTFRPPGTAASSRASTTPATASAHRFECQPNEGQGVLTRRAEGYWQARERRRAAPRLSTHQADPSRCPSAPARGKWTGARACRLWSLLQQFCQTRADKKRSVRFSQGVQTACGRDSASRQALRGARGAAQGGRAAVPARGVSRDSRGGAFGEAAHLRRTL